MLTPCELAFETEEVNIPLLTIDMFFNTAFFIDIFVNFTSAYYDAENNMIDDHRVSIFESIFIF